MMTTPTDLPDLAHRRPTLVAVPPQASRHMDLADVTALAMDRIAAASLGAPLADDDGPDGPLHTLTIEFDGDSPFFTFACHAPADALCHAEWSCGCEEWSTTEVRNGLPAHRVYEYDEDHDTEREAWHAGEFDPEFCNYREWFDNSDERVNGSVVVAVKPELHGDYYTFEIGGAR